VTISLQQNPTYVSVLKGINPTGLTRRY